jgi:imidazoleglycerol phosphate synthase glutamine amidotransferase subunit HisH
MQEKLKSKLNSGKILFYLVQNTSSMYLLNIRKLKSTEMQTCLGFCIGMQLVFSYYKKKLDPGWSKVT